MAIYMYVVNEDSVKVGFTENMESRIKAYKTHNPMAKLIDVYYGGTINDESIIHQKMESDSNFHRIESTEWFSVNKEMYHILLDKKLSYFLELPPALPNPLELIEQSKINQDLIEQQRKERQEQFMKKVITEIFPVFYNSIDYIKSTIQKGVSYGYRYAYISLRPFYDELHEKNIDVTFRDMHIYFDMFLKENGYKETSDDWDTKRGRYAAQHSIKW